jgi:predicted phosphodiesterase
MNDPKSQRRPSTAPPPRREAQRIGLIGDVHTEYARLRTAIAHLRSQEIDLMVCTGDLPDGASTPADVDRCCAMLRDEGVLTICGNHDRWLQDGEMRELAGATPLEELSPKTRAYLAELPTTIELATPVGLVLLCHGLGDNDMAQVQAHERGKELSDNEALQTLLKDARYRIVINGHTHKAGVLEIEGLTLINAGTLRRDRNPCCSVIDFEAREVVFYDITDAGPITERSRQKLQRR